MTQIEFLTEGSNSIDITSRSKGRVGKDPEELSKYVLIVDEVPASYQFAA